MTIRTPIANQGEIRIDRIDAMPACETVPHEEKDDTGAHIISHSEQGHHHVIDGNVDVLERTDMPAGMRVLYAIVKDATSLRQTAAAPHAPVALDPGLYEFRIKREFDPFTEQVRAVTD